MARAILVSPEKRRTEHAEAAAWSSSWPWWFASGDFLGRHRQRLWSARHRLHHCRRGFPLALSAALGFDLDDVRQANQLHVKRDHECRHSDALVGGYPGENATDAGVLLQPVAWPDCFLDH